MDDDVTGALFALAAFLIPIGIAYVSVRAGDRAKRTRRRHN